MIPKLRKKFISITAAALFAVILLVVGSINCIFIVQNTRLLSSHLDLLLRQYSTELPFDSMPGRTDIPGDGRIPGNGSQDFAPPQEPGGSAPLKHHPDANFSNREKRQDNFSILPRFENRLRMRTDGCVILLAADGSIAAIHQDAAENYSAEELEDIVSKILDSGKSQGWHHYYKYRVTVHQTQNGASETVIGLVNGSSMLYSIFTMLSVSALIGIFSFLVVLMIIIFASGRAVQPIAESYARQKQFVTDAGHELKTPLTVISANNELARMIYGDSEWFDSIDKQVGKMNALVRSLITLSKMDEEQQPVFTVFNLSDAVYDTAKSFENLIHTRGRVLTLDIGEDISYSGDESRLRQLVSILMDNAVKYCDDKGKIAVRLTVDKSISLQITNDYTGSDGFDPEKVFERFYRGDKARTPDGSYGLGLSIAKSIVELHRGSIRAKVLDHGRVQFEVMLPKGK